MCCSAAQKLYLALQLATADARELDCAPPSRPRLVPPPHQPKETSTLPPNSLVLSGAYKRNPRKDRLMDVPNAPHLRKCAAFQLVGYLPT